MLLNKGVIIAIIAGIIIAGVVGAVTLNVEDDSQTSQSETNESETQPQGREITIHLEESMGMKTNP